VNDPDQLVNHCASVLYGLPALFWSTDRDLRLTAASGSALSGAAVTLAGYTGKLLQSLFRKPKAYPKAQFAHNRALAGQSQSFVSELNGREFLAFVGPLKGPDGEIAGTAGFAFDCTNRLVTERAVRMSEYSYRSLIDGMPIAIFRCTMSGQLLHVNCAMENMLGYTPASDSKQGELLLQDLPQIFLPGGFEEFRQAIGDTSVLQWFDSVWLRRDGGRINVSLSGRALVDENSVATCIDVVAQDVTEKKQLEVQLRHAQRMQVVGQLAGGMAHHFNNLLTVISGQSQMLLMEQPDEPMRARLLALQEAADRASELTRQMLAFSRRQVLQSKVIDMNTLVDHFLGILKRLTGPSIEVRFLPDSNAGCVLADPTQIEQVLMNLAVNARDAMPGGGALRIETAFVCFDQALPGPESLAAGEYVGISVLDTGHGMDAATKDRIFEPFYTTKPVGSGTGLGLSMAYGIVRQSGGQITVESSPGQGATFTICLPRVRSEMESFVKAGDPVAGLSPGGVTILVAEDVDAVRELLAEYLESLGYHVLSARDGQDALGLAAAYPGHIELLLTDLSMPRMGGRELAENLLRMIPKVTIVFMSGYAGDDVELNLPGAAFLAKPLSLELLASTVRAALQSVSG
jgi:two-component system cell cycle sensor histidine kinase/response regulator CckA